jgi:hypothetical protein
MRRGLRSALAGLLAAAAAGIGVAAVQVATAAPASATCSGKGVVGTFSIYVGNTLVARETAQYASTCDHDNYYAGKVLDAYTDGSCAYAKYYDAGIWSTQGIDCTTGGYVNYSFRDRNGNSSATFRLAVDYAYLQGPTWGY